MAGMWVGLVAFMIGLMWIVVRIVLTKTYSSWAGAASERLCQLADRVEGTDGEYADELKAILMTEPEDAGVAFAVQSLRGASSVRARASAVRVGGVGKMVVSGGRRLWSRNHTGVSSEPDGGGEAVLPDETGDSIVLVFPHHGGSNVDLAPRNVLVHRDIAADNVFIHGDLSEENIWVVNVDQPHDEGPEVS